MRACFRLMLSAVALWSTAAVAQAPEARLPEYRPAQSISGIVRIQGSNRMAEVMKLWADGFRKHHPGVTFDLKLRGNSSAMPALEESVADLVLMSRQIVPYDTYGIWRRGHLMPLEFTVGTGSFDVPQKSYALSIFVHKDNPITRLTVKQLDGIFGAQRTGGWKGMEWEPGSARGPEGNILTWGQLGAKGAWANKPIIPYAPPNMHPGGMSYFQIRVLGGSDATAEKLKEFADRGLMMRTMSRDRYGIAYTGMNYKTADVKAIPIAQNEAGPFVMPTRETVANGTYPLSRAIYIYVAPDAANGDPRAPDPKVREFLRYVLSREGQQDIVREGDFLPLTAAAADHQRRRID